MPQIYNALRVGNPEKPDYLVRMRLRDLTRDVNSGMHGNHGIHYSDLAWASWHRMFYSRRVELIIDFLLEQGELPGPPIVIAAFGGEPTFSPVEGDLDFGMGELFRGMGFFDDIGLLTFSGEQRYFVLDGRYRLMATEKVFDERSRIDRDFNVSDETLSRLGETVFPVVIKSLSSDLEQASEQFRASYENLHRHPLQPVGFGKFGDDESILFSQEDVFAVITRNLMARHPFFGPKDRVAAERKRLASHQPYFTTLDNLYDMNVALLSSSERKMQWKRNELDAYRRVRPPEAELNLLYEELVVYWDALIEALPILNSPPDKMRYINRTTEGADDREDANLWFFTLGQQIITPVVRDLLDRISTDEVGSSDATDALRPLSLIDWSLFAYPWNHLIRIATDKSGRAILNRSAVSISRRIIRWIIGLDQLTKDDVEELRTRFHGMQQFPETIGSSEISKIQEKSWEEVERFRHAQIIR